MEDLDIRGRGQRERQRALKRAERAAAGLRPRGTGSVFLYRKAREGDVWRGVYRWRGTVRYVQAPTRDLCETRLEARRRQDDPEVRFLQDIDEAREALLLGVGAQASSELVALIRRFLGALDIHAEWRRFTFGEARYQHSHERPRPAAAATATSQSTSTVPTPCQRCDMLTIQQPCLACQQELRRAS